MKPTLIHVCAVLSVLSLSACSDPLEPGSKVDSLRVLAEQADLPFARPGERVQLSSLSFDPAGRELNWAWASCTNPSSADLQGCLEQIESVGELESAVFASGQGVASVELRIPSDAIEALPSEARPTAELGVISVACPGQLSFETGAAGLPFRCQEAASGRELELDEFSVGLKRISVRESDRNQNPRIVGISFDGTDWPADEVKQVGSCDSSEYVYGDCPDDEKHQLALQVSADSFESGRDEYERDFAEELVLQYYATEGIFEYEVKLAEDPGTGWVARRRASGQTLTLWFVARDDRGGVSWIERQVQVR